MNDVEERRTPKECLAIAIKLIIALWFGVLALLMGLNQLLIFAESPAEKIRLGLAALLLPLSVLTIWLVARLLGWRPTKLS